jgi:hypothetical protein
MLCSQPKLMEIKKDRNETKEMLRAGADFEKRNQPITKARTIKTRSRFVKRGNGLMKK